MSDRSLKFQNHVMAYCQWHFLLLYALVLLFLLITIVILPGALRTVSEAFCRVIL